MFLKVSGSLSPGYSANHRRQYGVSSRYIALCRASPSNSIWPTYELFGGNPQFRPNPLTSHECLAGLVAMSCMSTTLVVRARSAGRLPIVGRFYIPCIRSPALFKTSS